MEAVKMARAAILLFIRAYCPMRAEPPAIANGIVYTSRSRMGWRLPMNGLPTRLLAGWIAFGCFGGAQTQDAARKIQALEERVAAQRRLLKDWGGLTRYGSDNTE